MKKIIGLLSLSTVLFIAACSDQTKTVETTKEVPAAPAPAPAPAKTEVIVVQPTPTVVVKEAPKPTTIVLDKNGVKVGTKKVEVVIEKP